MEGLRTLEILELVKKFPRIFRPYFCYTATTLTATLVDEIFKPVYSDEECRIREREELIIMHWRDYLQEREGNAGLEFSGGHGGHWPSMPCLLAAMPSK